MRDYRGGLYSQALGTSLTDPPLSLSIGRKVSSLLRSLEVYESSLPSLLSHFAYDKRKRLVFQT